MEAKTTIPPTKNQLLRRTKNELADEIVRLYDENSKTYEFVTNLQNKLDLAEQDRDSYLKINEEIAVKFDKLSAEYTACSCDLEKSQNEAAYLTKQVNELTEALDDQAVVINELKQKNKDLVKVVATIAISAIAVITIILCV